MSQFLENEIIDIDELTTELSAEQVAGIDIRQDATFVNSYYHLHDCRQDVRRLERVGEELDPQLNIDIIKSCKEILLNTSKDIEICCWLIEAMTQQFGFVGLHDSVLLLNKLIEMYGTSLHPCGDDDFPEQQVVTILALDGNEHPGTLEKAMYLAPLFTVNDEKISLWDWQKNNDIHPEQITNLYNGLSIEDKKYNRKIFDQCLAEIQILEDNIVKLHPENMLGLSSIKSILKDAINVIDKISQSQQIEVCENEIDLQTQQNNSTKITTQDNYSQVLNNLSEVIFYFKQNQPHSVVTYNLMRIERWLSMSLNDILREVVYDNNSRLEIERGFGIPVLDRENNT